MTTKSKSAPEAPAPTFDPAAYYRVQLGRVVEWKGNLLSPGKRTTVRGDVAEALGDAVASYERV